MARWTSTVYADLPPKVDSAGRLASITSRTDSDPSTQAPAYVLAALLKDRAACERTGARRGPHRGSVTRVFVTLQFCDAQVVNATRVACISERALRNFEPSAVTEVEVLRSAGADVIFVRGEHAAHVAVIFTEAIGKTILVAQEALHELVDGRWKHVVDDPARMQEPHRLLGPGLGLAIAWQLVVAMFVVGAFQSVAGIAAGISGLTIGVPIWGLLICSIPFSLRLRVVIRNRWQRSLTQDSSRYWPVEGGMRDEAEYWRQVAHAESDWHHEDDDDTRGDDDGPHTDRAARSSRS